MAVQKLQILLFSLGIVSILSCLYYISDGSVSYQNLNSHENVEVASGQAALIQRCQLEDKNAEASSGDSRSTRLSKCMNNPDGITTIVNSTNYLLTVTEKNIAENKSSSDTKREEGEFKGDKSPKPSPYPNSIFTFTNISARFIEAAKRINTIPTESLRRIGYPGVSIHRRNWKFPLTVPDCSEEVDNLLIMVPSAPKNFADRNAVRSTWGNLTELRKINSQILFIIGLTKDEEVQKRIADEHVKYQDIVQLDLYDAYYNLTIKTLGMFTWAQEHCKTAKYVAKIDDDNIVNLQRILNILDNFYTKHTKFIAGSYRPKTPPARRGKWGDPVYRKLYNNTPAYPPFLGGPAYFLTNNFLGRLVQQCTELPLLHLEDVFVTGICAEQLKDVHKLSIVGMYMSVLDGCMFLRPGVNLAHNYPLEHLQPTWDKWHSGQCKV